MDNLEFCCGQGSANGRAVLQPFSRMIALGFYDGPTSGVLRCAACDAEFRFDMLDWGDDHEVRVFRLAALPAGAIAQCTAVLEKVEQPHWPVWVPFARTRPTEEVRAALGQQLEKVLNAAAPAEWVVAWTGYGDRLLAAGRVPANVLAGVPDWFAGERLPRGTDWFDLLRLAKDGAEAKA